jgi:septum site-determining protein MinC
MSRAAEAREELALDIRFGPLDLAQVRIRSLDPGVIVDELTGRVASAPRFFERTAVALDLGLVAAAPQPNELRAVVDAVRRAGMLPVGLVAGPAYIEDLARTLDMPVLAQFRATGKVPPVLKPVETQPQRPEEPPEREPPPASGSGLALLHPHPVRSGQRIYARYRDLVVTAPVGAGAEVMADGCVHVYGALRGRAMAGARGETAARVFCQEFHAELVSVAGIFKVFETLPPQLAGRAVQVWLDGNDLKLERIG